MIVMLTDGVAMANQIISLICAVVGLICTLIPIVIVAIRFVAKAIKDKNWKQLRSIADTAMKEVEDYSKKHPAITSEDKLKMALDIRQKTLVSRNIAFSDKDKENVEAYINQTIKWFNSRK